MPKIQITFQVASLRSDENFIRPGHFHRRLPNFVYHRQLEFQ